MDAGVPLSLDGFRPLLDDAARAHDGVFMAVGALHLVGDDGLEKMFRDAGYEVERLH